MQKQALLLNFLPKINRNSRKTRNFAPNVSNSRKFRLCPKPTKVPSRNFLITDDTKTNSVAQTVNVNLTEMDGLKTKNLLSRRKSWIRRVNSMLVFFVQIQ